MTGRAARTVLSVGRRETSRPPAVLCRNASVRCSVGTAGEALGLGRGGISVSSASLSVGTYGAAGERGCRGGETQEFLLEPSSRPPFLPRMFLVGASASRPGDSLKERTGDRTDNPARHRPACPPS